MKAENRRKEIALYLMSAQAPVSGSALSERFGVSRQIIVQDIAKLKAEGYEIRSTHYGYTVKKSPLVERVFKVRHSEERTEEELNAVVELGGTVVDVFVWHKVYGKIAAKLNIYSEDHVEEYMKGVRSGKSIELMNVTGGYHYHTIRADSEEALKRIENALAAKNFLVAGD